MNLNEYPRITILPLPNPNDEQRVVNRKFIDCIGYLSKRDEDKEKRIRALEDQVGRGRKIVRDIELITADHQITGFYNDRIIVGTAAANTNLGFPHASGSQNIIIVKNFGAGTITAVAAGVDTIDENPVQIVLPNEGIIFLDYAVGNWLVT